MKRVVSKAAKTARKLKPKLESLMVLMKVRWKAQTPVPLLDKAPVCQSAWRLETLLESELAAKKDVLKGKPAAAGTAAMLVEQLVV